LHPVNVPQAQATETLKDVKVEADARTLSPLPWQQQPLLQDTSQAQEI
jgi:hypothetical protein